MQQDSLAKQHEMLREQHDNALLGVLSFSEAPVFCREVIANFSRNEFLSEFGRHYLPTQLGEAWLRAAVAELKIGKGGLGKPSSARSRLEKVSKLSQK